MKKILLLFALCVAVLAGCGKKDAPAAEETAAADAPLVIGGQTVDPEVSSLTAVLSAGETEKLDALPNLRFLESFVVIVVGCVDDFLICGYVRAAIRTEAPIVQHGAAVIAKHMILTSIR